MHAGGLESTREELLEAQPGATVAFGVINATLKMISTVQKTKEKYPKFTSLVW